MKYVQRIITLWIDPDTIRFETDKQQDEFHKALGRQVMFALGSSDDGDVSYSAITVDREREIDAAHYRALSKADRNLPWHGTPRQRIEDALKTIGKEFEPTRPFVLGAVPRDGGNDYSFHS